MVLVLVKGAEWQPWRWMSTQPQQALVFSLVFVLLASSLCRTDPRFPCPLTCFFLCWLGHPWLSMTSAPIPGLGAADWARLELAVPQGTLL